MGRRKKFQSVMAKELKKRSKKWNRPTKTEWQKEFTKAVKATKMKLGKVM